MDLVPVAIETVETTLFPQAISQNSQPVPSSQEFRFSGGISPFLRD